MFRLEVIDYFDSTNQSLIARVPESGSAAIQFGAQLIVQQNQTAVFFRDGRAMDQFGPGRHTLTTANIPILTRILTAPFEKSPFQAQVYFVARQTFVDQRWGTRQPITLRDPDFGIVRLRGFGKFAYRVIDAPLLLNTLIGSQGKLTTESIVDYLREIIVAGLTDVFATAKVSLLDMPGKLDDLSALTRVKLGDQFNKFGLELTELFISSVTPPEEVQKAIDARSGMSVLGDLRSFTLYQAAKGMEAAGQGNGGGIGLGMGMALPSLLQQAFAAGNLSAPKQGIEAAVHAELIGNSGSKSLPASLNQANPNYVDATSVAPSPEQLIRNLAEKSNWSIQPMDNGLVLNVTISPLQRQKVYVDFNSKDDEGYSVVRIWSCCGVISPSNAMLFLRSNNELIHGAFALQKHLDVEQLVIKANLIAETMDPLEAVRCISALAWQADALEQQLSDDSDQF